MKMTRWWWRFKRLVDRRVSRFFLGHPVIQAEAILLLAILLSLLCGGVAVALHRAIEIVEHLMHTGGEGVHGGWRPVVVVLTPALGGLLVGLLLRYVVPAARGSGVPQVKVDLVMRGGRIPIRVAIGKFVCTTLAVGSGGSIGREGPTVQICASLASSLARWIPITATQLRILVHTACVSGVSAAFNTPIAGMTFVMEEIIGDLSAAHVGYFIFAAVAAAMVSRQLLGNSPVFDVPQYALGHPAELVLYVLLGALAAVVSVIFIRTLVWSVVRFQNLKIPEYLKPASAGLCIGLIALALPQVLGVGYATVTDAMQNRLTWSTMGVLLAAKFVATIVCYGSGTAGGLFAPSLFLGAMLGGSLASLIGDVTSLNVLAPGAFALVGMGAVFVGIIRTPVTSILIIFEMTNDYALILPLMLANMTSYALSKKLEPQNVYEAILAVNNVHLPSHEDYASLDEFTAEDAMVRHPMTVAPEMAVPEALAILERYPYRSLPVTGVNRQLLGLITVHEVLRALAAGQAERTVRDIALSKPLVYAHPDHTLHWVLQQMGERDLSVMPVASRTMPPRLLGLLTLTDIARAFARHHVPRGDGDSASDHDAVR